NEAPHRLVESRAGNRSRAHGVGDQAVSLELSALVEPEQEVVRARLDRAEPGRRLANALERTHLEVVGDDKALKTERVAYEIGHHGLRERHWELGRGIEGRNDDVRAHDRGDAGRDRSAERRKLDAVERRPIRLDLGQAGVRVRRRRAMPWEMLRAREKPCRGVCLDGGGHERRDPRGIAGEGAVADDRVRRLIVHVRHRREVPVHPESAQLGRVDHRGGANAALRVRGRRERAEEVAAPHGSWTGRRPSACRLPASTVARASSEAGTSPYVRSAGTFGTSAASYGLRTAHNTPPPASASFTRDACSGWNQAFVEETTSR